MRDPALNSSFFPVSQCNRCGKTVLTYIVLTESDEQRRCCVHCDGPVGSRLAWITAAELETEGYQFGAPADSHKGEGCTVGGCGSCATRRN